MPEQPLEDALKHRIWRAALAENGVTVEAEEVLHAVHKGDGSLLFAMLRARLVGPDGHTLPPVVVLRGHFVSVLTLLREAETGAEYLLLVKQRRVATGGVFYEHPAGMCDGDADPYDVAVKEVEEETGVTVQRGQLVLLNEAPLYVSPGLLDEGGYFFYCRLDLPAAEIDALRHRQTGAAHENERIETAVVPPAEAFALIKNANGLLNLFLYQKATGHVF